MTETSYRMSREQVDAFLAAPRHAIIAAQTSSGGDRMFSRERTFPGCVRVAAVLVTALLVIADASSESHDFVPAFGDLRFGDSEESVSQILGGLSKSSYGRRGKVPTVIAGDSFWVDVDFTEDRLWRIVLVSEDGHAGIGPMSAILKHKYGESTFARDRPDFRRQVSGPFFGCNTDQRWVFGRKRYLSIYVCEK